jgi:hypothetical protein
MTCDEIDDLLPGLALGAATDKEAREVTRHLQTCNRHARWEDFHRVAEALAMSVEPVKPAGHVKQRLMGRVYRDLEPRLAGRSWRWVSGWVAAAALALVTLGLGIREHMLAGQLASAPVQWQLQPAEAGLEASGTLVWLPSTSTATLTLHQLPPLPASEVYEVWLIKNGAPAAAGIFQPAPDNSASVILKGDPPAYDTLAITKEPGPNGTQAPTSPPLMAASLK